MNFMKIMVKTVMPLLLTAIMLVSCSKPIDLIPIANDAGLRALRHVDDCFNEIWIYYDTEKDYNSSIDILPIEAIKIIGYNQGRSEILADISTELDTKVGDNEDYRELISATISLLSAEIALLANSFEIYETIGDESSWIDLTDELDKMMETRNSLAGFIGEKPRYSINPETDNS